MANINGLPVNSAVTHAEFMSRTEDTSTTGAVNFQNTTDSSDPTTGAIKTAGGAGVAKSLNVGENASVGGELIVSGETTLNDTLNASAIVSDGNINTTANMNAVDVNATGAVTALIEVITPLITATTADIDTLNLTNALTVPSITVTADAVIDGNLTVNGTTTTLNTATVDSEDPNITINKTGNDASSEGAGFTVDRTGTKGSLVYANALASKFKIGDLASEAEVVTVSHTQTLTNKTLTSPILTTPSTDIISATEQGSTPATPAGGVRKLYPKADGFYQLDSTGLETKVGSGSGGGGVVNLITNGSADDAITSIFAPYADAAGTRPVDGTGGSPTVTTSISAVSPLTGTKSYLLTKPASNTQGQGWAVSTVPLDLSYRAKALKISVDYVVNSGTFVAGSRTTDSDIIWSCYDITNSKIVEPSNIKMFASSTSISDKFEATVQFDYNCTSFRLIAHCATTSALAYEIKVDNVTVSPSVYVYGSPITDWQSWTPTGSWTTNTTYTGKKRQVGDEYEYMVKIATSGAPTAAGLTINLQETIDTAKLNSTVQYASAFESSGNAFDGATGGYSVKALYSTPTSVAITNIALPEGLVSNTVPFTFGAGDEINVRFTLPILGLSSSVQMSDSTDTRIVLSTSQIAAAATTTNGGIIQFNTVTKDTHGSITTGAAWKHTVVVAGDYRVSINMDVNIAANYQVYLNGVSQGYILSAPLNLYGFGQRTLPNLKAGDYIHFVSDTGGTVQAASYCTIERISGPSAIAANESINAVYTTAAGQSIPNATDTIIDFGTVEINSHGNVTTGAAWKFTSQINAVYELSCYVQLNSGGGWAVSEEVVVSIFKNGTGLATIGLCAETVANSVAVSIPCSPRQVRLLAGEYIDVRINQNSGAALSLVSADVRNWVSIKKVGN